MTKSKTYSKEDIIRLCEANAIITRLEVAKHGKSKIDILAINAEINRWRITIEFILEH